MKALSVIEGGVSVLDRDDVDTDQIMPKQFLKRIERTGFGEFLFYDWAKQPGWHLPPNPILATGRNFGCGSSREHAPWGLEDYGFEAIVAPSFSDIFFSNCTKIGLLPVVLPEDEVRALMQSDSARIDLEEQTVTHGDTVARFEIDQETKRRLLGGLDDIGVTLLQNEKIAAYERDRERDRPAHRRMSSGSGAARLGRRELRPRLHAPARDGAARARPAAARGPRDGARRRLRLRAGHRRPARAAAARSRGGRGRRAVDGRPGAGALRVRAARAGARPRQPHRARAGGAAWTRVFSNAVFHWIKDHDALFERLHAALRPGAPLVAQCGGKGNIDVFRRLADEVAAEPPYAEHMSEFEGPWNYAAPAETEERLLRAGFGDVRCWLEPWPVNPGEPLEYASTVCLGNHLAGAARGAARARSRRRWFAAPASRCGSTTCA